MLINYCKSKLKVCEDFKLMHQRNSPCKYVNIKNLEILPIFVPTRLILLKIKKNDNN